MRKITEEQRLVLACYPEGDRNEVIKQIKDSIELIQDQWIKEIMEELIQVLEGCSEEEYKKIHEGWVVVGKEDFE